MKSNLCLIMLQWKQAVSNKLARTIEVEEDHGNMLFHSGRVFPVVCYEGAMVQLEHVGGSRTHNRQNK